MRHPRIAGRRRHPVPALSPHRERVRCNTCGRSVGIAGYSGPVRHKQRKGARDNRPCPGGRS